MAGKYYFNYEVREGQPGCADDDSYVNRPYDTFKSAYRNMVSFDVDRFWPYLRSVRGLWIWQEGQPKVNVESSFGITTDDLPKLGVTKEEFSSLQKSMRL